MYDKKISYTNSRLFSALLWLVTPPPTKIHVQFQAKFKFDYVDWKYPLSPNNQNYSTEEIIRETLERKPAITSVTNTSPVPRKHIFTSFLFLLRCIFRNLLQLLVLFIVGILHWKLWNRKMLIDGGPKWTIKSWNKDNLPLSASPQVVSSKCRCYMRMWKTYLSQ